MNDNRKFIHAIFLFALPVIVAWYGVSTAGAIALVLLALAWRWAIVIAGFVRPPKIPTLELETIGISHFAEKVRWCLDRLGVEYSERRMAGIIGVLFTGRSVPVLRFRTGMVTSSIGNSPEILRYLWGRYHAELGQEAAFLEPTAERLEMERMLDRYGVHLQIWVYYHILAHKDIALRAWGVFDPRVPAWQRGLVKLLYPLLRLFLERVFKITEAHYQRTVENIDKLFDEVESRLDDGRRSILGGDETDFVDITMAALSTIWVQPEEFAGGASKDALIGQGGFPIQMGVDVERWADKYPLTKAFVERLYREERTSA